VSGSVPPPSSWPQLLGQLLRGHDLTADDAAWAMATILAGDATDAQIAAFVTALRAKGESAPEVAGLASAMLAAAAALDVPPDREPLVDTCGTGGDGRHTVNLSTMAALVVAGTGAAVAKHGNRAASSACGSADLLEELGVVVDLPPVAVGRCLADAGLAFCFAPVFHPAFRHASGPRREMGVPTVFNVLGPLTNPARPAAQVVGVADPRLAPVMARVLAARGTSALVVHGEDGLDELSTSAPSRVWVVAGGEVVEERVHPADLGLEAGDLMGGDAAHNAGVCRDFLAGGTGAVRDAVLLNAAAALVARDALTAAGPRGSVQQRLAGALSRAAAAVDDGGAAAALDRWVRASERARSPEPG
jgi:anthranilate phosphoribosyltransferase